MTGKINLNDLRRVCSFSYDDFKVMFPDSVWAVDSAVASDDSKIKGALNELSAGDSYIYIDRGASILGVSHLDFVYNPFHYCEADLGGLTVFCPRLDDRLGVWGLLYGLPALVDCDYDVLLTTGEESGRSSASIFKASHDYNWIFELDRGGRDCVTYGIDSKDFRGALGRCDWSIGRGSFSDICCLDDLGVCAVNFGVGYHGAHTRLSHAFVSDIIGQLKRVARFVNKYHNTRFEYVKRALPVKAYNPSWRSWGGYDLGYSSRFGLKSDDLYCAMCGAWLSDSELSAGVCDKCLKSSADSASADSVSADSASCDYCGIQFSMDDLSEYEGGLICSDCFEWFSAVVTVDGDSADSAFGDSL